MGPLQPASLPPRSHPDNPVHPTPLLVALHRDDVREFVAACDICDRSKTSHHPPAGLLRPLPIPGRPWSHNALDLVTGIPTSQGNTTILDHGRLLLKDGPLRHPPETPIRGRNRGPPRHASGPATRYPPGHRLEPWPPVSLSSGYHPQTNGQAEHANQALEATLQCVTTSKPTSWSSHLPWVEYSLNSMMSVDTSLSPFQCSLGYQPPLFPSQETEVAVPSVRALLHRCWRIWKAARHSMLSNQDRV